MFAHRSEDTVRNIHPPIPKTPQRRTPAPDDTSIHTPCPINLIGNICPYVSKTPAAIQDEPPTPNSLSPMSAIPDKPPSTQYCPYCSLCSQTIFPSLTALNRPKNTDRRRIPLHPQPQFHQIQNLNTLIPTPSLPNISRHLSLNNNHITQPYPYPIGA